MKIADRVTYVDAFGVAHEATVAGVAGTGASWYKVLDLTVDGTNAIRAVPSAYDRMDGAGYWVLPTAVTIDEPEPAPVFPSAPLPPPDVLEPEDVREPDES